MSSRIILLDIFSYSCMNCLRSLEFIKKIDRKYKRLGLDTILIHPPEWGFEKNKDNIASALKKYNITFPVMIDKNKKIIKKLNINFWPAQILMGDGKILYTHIGEGSYKKLERKIADFLKVKSKKIFKDEPVYSRFRAIYCGKSKHGRIIKLKNKIKFGILYKDGKWMQKNEFAIPISRKSSLTLLTKGRITSFAAESLNKKSIKVGIMLNDKFIKKMTINRPQSYDIIKLKNNKQQKLALTANPGLAIYSFSFQ